MYILTNNDMLVMYKCLEFKNCFFIKAYVFRCHKQYNITITFSNKVVINVSSKSQ